MIPLTILRILFCCQRSQKMIPMDSDYRAERAAARAEREKRQKKIKVHLVIYQIMERRIDPASASGIGRKISSYLS